MAHIDAEQLDQLLQRVPGFETFDVRDARLESERATRLLTEGVALDGATVIGDLVITDARLKALHMVDASLEGRFELSGCTLAGAASFGKSSFQGGADFDGTRFKDAADFEGTSFEGPASFKGTRFDGHADFSQIHAQEGLWAEDAVFTDRLTLSDATVSEASFARAVFHCPVWFHGTRFKNLRAEDASFQGAQSMGDVVAMASINLEGVTSEGRLDLRVDTPFLNLSGGRLRAGGRLGVRVSRVSDEPPRLALSGLTCEVPFTIVSVPRLDSDAEWRGMQTELSHAEKLHKEADQALEPVADSTRERPNDLVEELERNLVKLDEVAPDFRELGDPELSDRAAEVRKEVVGLQAKLEASNTQPDEPDTNAKSDTERLRSQAGNHLRAAAYTFLEQIADNLREVAGRVGEKVQLRPPIASHGLPQVLDVEDVDLAPLILEGLDMSICSFAGAQNLDHARIDCIFARSPDRIRWSRRLIIADERSWRLNRNGGDDWKRPECGPPDRAERFLTHGEVLPGAPQLADLYRSLRKGREDAKDEPGAADFYYGEMEMRRHSGGRALGRTGDFGERVVLWLYWLVSGYGLRASRALVALLVTILAFAALFYTFGLNDRDVSLALLQSIQGAAFRSGDQQLLTEAGQYFQLPLHLLGPLFFGLALLSLRGRVRR